MLPITHLSNEQSVMLLQSRNRVEYACQLNTFGTIACAPTALTAWGIRLLYEPDIKRHADT